MQIAKEFNVQTINKRLPDQLRNLWKSLKKNCRKKLADEKVISISVDVSLFTACWCNVCLHYVMISE